MWPVVDIIESFNFTEKLNLSATLKLIYRKWLRELMRTQELNNFLWILYLNLSEFKPYFIITAGLAQYSTCPLQI